MPGAAAVLISGFFSTISLINERVKFVKLNNKRCERLAQRITSCSQLFNTLSEWENEQSYKQALEEMGACLSACLTFIEELSAKSKFLQLKEGRKNDNRITELNQKFQDAMSTLKLSLHVNQTVHSEEDRRDREEDFAEIRRILEEIQAEARQQHEVLRVQLETMKTDRHKQNAAVRAELQQIQAQQQQILSSLAIFMTQASSTVSPRLLEVESPTAASAAPAVLRPPPTPFERAQQLERAQQQAIIAAFGLSDCYDSEGGIILVGNTRIEIPGGLKFWVVLFTKDSSEKSSRAIALTTGDGQYLVEVFRTEGAEEYSLGVPRRRHQEVSVYSGDRYREDNYLAVGEAEKKHVLQIFHDASKELEQAKAELPDIPKQMEEIIIAVFELPRLYRKWCDGPGNTLTESLRLCGRQFEIFSFLDEALDFSQPPQRIALRRCDNTQYVMEVAASGLQISWLKQTQPNGKPSPLKEDYTTEVSETEIKQALGRFYYPAEANMKNVILEGFGLSGRDEYDSYSKAEGNTKKIVGEREFQIVRFSKANARTVALTDGRYLMEVLPAHVPIEHEYDGGLDTHIDVPRKRREEVTGNSTYYEADYLRRVFGLERMRVLKFFYEHAVQALQQRQKPRALACEATVFGSGGRAALPSPQADNGKQCLPAFVI